MSEDCLSEDRAAKIRKSVLEKYRAVARAPGGHFAYPVGRESAARLGYAAEWLAAVPPETVERFVGVGNPYSLRKPAAGMHVLDAGCGCGLDTFVAALLTGSHGRAVGLDLCPEMLAWPRQAAARSAMSRVDFLKGSLEALPFADESFDLVISNGVLSLVPDKDRAFREISRVLRAGGALAAADLAVVESMPEKMLQDLDAWSN